MKMTSPEAGGPFDGPQAEDDQVSRLAVPLVVRRLKMTSPKAGGPFGGPQVEDNQVTSPVVPLVVQRLKITERAGQRVVHLVGHLLGSLVVQKPKISCPVVHLVDRQNKRQ